MFRICFPPLLAFDIAFVVSVAQKRKTVSLASVVFFAQLPENIPQWTTLHSAGSWTLSWNLNEFKKKDS